MNDGRVHWSLAPAKIARWAVSCFLTKCRWMNQHSAWRPFSTSSHEVVCAGSRASANRWVARLPMWRRRTGCLLTSWTVAGALFVRTAHAIEGGVVDETHPYSVALCVGDPTTSCLLQCTGSLIAPNAVLTVRHCFLPRPNKYVINCSEDQFAAKVEPPVNYWVTTAANVGASRVHWRRVRSLETPLALGVCGNDVAIAILDDVIPANEATPGTPIFDENEFASFVKESSFAASGFGKTNALEQVDEGVRHLLRGVPIRCVVGDGDRPCPVGILGSLIADQEYLAGSGFCQGDSGAAAISLESANMPPAHIHGVLSRASVSDGKCVDSVFEKLVRWRPFISDTVIRTAARPDDVPTWAREPYERVSAGQACRHGSECADGFHCVDGGSDRGLVCAAPCGSDNACSSSFVCENAICVTPHPPAVNDGGCSIPKASHRERGLIAIAMLILTIVLVRRFASSRHIRN